jgi:hypothetical protein
MVIRSASERAQFFMMKQVTVKFTMPSPEHSSIVLNFGTLTYAAFGYGNFDVT